MVKENVNVIPWHGFCPMTFLLKFPWKLTNNGACITEALACPLTKKKKNKTQSLSSPPHLEQKIKIFSGRAKDRQQHLPPTCLCVHLGIRENLDQASKTITSVTVDTDS